MSSSSNQNQPKSPTQSLRELKQRLNNAEQVVVGQDGRIHSPDDPEIASKPMQERTVLKPQRWFARDGGEGRNG